MMASGPWCTQVAVGIEEGVDVGVTVKVAVIVDVASTVGRLEGVLREGVAVFARPGTAIVIAVQANSSKATPKLNITILFTLAIKFKNDS